MGPPAVANSRKFSTELDYTHLDAGLRQVLAEQCLPEFIRDISSGNSRRRSSAILGRRRAPNRNIETSAMKRALSTLPQPKHPNPMFWLRNARNPITTRLVSMFRFGKGG